MFYVYVLRSTVEGSLYFGYTDDLRRRFAEHNRGLNQSTKAKRPWILVYYEAYRSRADAKYREGQIKRFAQATSQLRRRIKNSLII